MNFEKLYCWLCKTNPSSSGTSKDCVLCNRKVYASKYVTVFVNPDGLEVEINYKPNASIPKLSIKILCAMGHVCFQLEENAGFKDRLHIKLNPAEFAKGCYSLILENDYKKEDDCFFEIAV